MLMEVVRSKNSNREYIRRSCHYQYGQPSVIDRGSIEENIIADWMEQGMVFRNTTIMVNEYINDEGKVHIECSAARNAFI